MQKHFPSLSFCVGIAFGEHRAEAVARGWCGARVVWHAGEWRAVVWRTVGVRAVYVAGGAGAATSGRSTTPVSFSFSFFSLIKAC